MKKLQDFEIEFIEYTGMTMHTDGRLPKVAGRIFGLLVLRKEPVSFSDVAEILQVSKASISTSTRALESLGVIKRVSLMGHRQDHFTLPASPYAALMTGYLARMGVYQEFVSKSMQKAPKGSTSRKRLEVHNQFYTLSVENMKVLIENLKDVG